MDSAEDFRELDRREVGYEKIDITQHVSVVAVSNGSATKRFTNVYPKMLQFGCMCHALKIPTRQIKIFQCAKLM